MPGSALVQCSQKLINEKLKKSFSSAQSYPDLPDYSTSERSFYKASRLSVIYLGNGFRGGLKSSRICLCPVRVSRGFEGRDASWRLMCWAQTRS